MDRNQCSGWSGIRINQMDGDMVPPRKVIDAKFAKAVHQLAWRATTSVDFLLKGGNLERYIDSAARCAHNLVKGIIRSLKEWVKRDSKPCSTRRAPNVFDSPLHLVWPMFRE